MPSHATRRLPSRHRRLDGALADLPLEEPMLLTELDGFLTGVVVGPEPVLPGEWMRNVWGADDGGVPPFEDPLDVQWFADAVMARHGEIVRDLDRGRLQPIFDVDERSGDTLWETWLHGLAEAMDLRPERWEALAEDGATADAFAGLTMLIAVANDESDFDSVEINALEDRAPALLIDAVQRLYAARRVASGSPATPKDAPKVGRNDPCPCGSGRKAKRCCGSLTPAP